MIIAPLHQWAIQDSKSYVSNMSNFNQKPIVRLKRKVIDRQPKDRKRTQVGLKTY